MNRRQSTWMLHFIVLIFGFTGILGKLISLDAERLVFWRVLLGGGLVWLWLAVRGRGTTTLRKSDSLRPAFSTRYSMRRIPSFL